MKKSNITQRLSLRAKFKSASEIEVVIMDDKNNVQIELIPITVGRGNSQTDQSTKEPTTTEGEPVEKGVE